MHAKIGGMADRNWPRGDGEMAERIRAHDWAATPLGPTGAWPASLRIATRLLVNSRHPMFIWWGPDHIQIYNDAYRETMGPEKHPSALGRSGRETWAEIWDVIGPQIEQVMNGGPATWHEDQLVPVTRHGSLEAVWWTYSFSPIDDDAAPTGVGGVMVICRDVTAEHLAREAVADSEARHRILIESWTQAVWETDAKGVVVTDSPSWRAYTGQSLEEWLGYGWLDAIHPNDRAYAERQWRDAVAARGLVDAEFRLRAPDGGWRWTNVRAAPMLDAEGSIEKWFGLNLDIDERKRAEAALRESEERQAYLLELSDALRPLTDQEAIQAEAMRLLGERIGVNRAQYYIADDTGEYLSSSGGYTNGIPPAIGSFRLIEFGKYAYDGFHAGETQVVSDARTDPRISETVLRSYETVGFMAYIGVPFVQRGRLVGTVAVHQSDPRQWTVSEQLMVEETAERAGIAIEQARAESALRKSEEKYRTLFDAMIEGFYYAEATFDEQDRCVDLLYIDENPAAVRMIGQSAKGRRLSELAPYEQHWRDIFGHTARTGEPQWLERFATPDGIWYEFFVFKPAQAPSNHFAVVFNDVTARHQALEALRESDERQAFLLKLSDALRAEVDADAVANRAIQMLFEQLRLDRCYIALYRPAEDEADFPYQVGNDAVPALPPKVRLSDFPDAYEQVREKTYVIDDDFGTRGLSQAERANIEALGMRAMLASTIRKGEKNPLFSMVAVASCPRHWSASEITLVEETAERTWAAIERARAETALRESEEKYRSLFDAMDEAFALCELVRDSSGCAVDYRYVELNPALTRHSGFSPDMLRGRLASEAFPDLDPWLLQTYTRVVDEGRSVLVEHHYTHVDRWMRINAFPRGGDRFAVLYSDVTDRHRAQKTLRESEERQAFLLKLSDAVRPLAGSADIQGETSRMLREQLNAGWCYYVDWDLDRTIGLVLRDSTSEGLPSLAGAHDVSDAPEFLQLLAVGAVLTARDYANYEQLSTRIREKFTALGFRSMMAAPLVKEGRLIASLLVGDTEIRDWTASEASLLVEVAERTWAAIERARAEAALRESEERFRTMTDNAPVLIWETDQNGATSVNHHYTEFFGVGVDEVVGMGWAKFLHPDDAKGYFDAYSEAFRRRTAYSYECRFLRADGQYRWLRNSGGPVGENRFVGCSLDLTDLLNAQEAMRESAERQRLMVELVPALLWSASHDGQEISLNERWLAYTGQSEAETQDYGWLDAIHPDDRAATRAAFAHAFATGEPLERLQRVRKAGDGWRWHLARQVPVRDAQGAITGWFGAAVDIHESKLAEQAVREAELRLQTLVEGVPQLVWRAVDDGRWTWASPQWTAYTGQAEADSHDRGWLEPVHPDDRADVLAIWDGAMERGEFHADYRIRHEAEHRYRWFQSRATTVRDERGEITEWLGTSTDVDDIRAMQERQGVLVAELQHRTRNLMGIVLAMANRTGEASRDLEDFRARFRDRLEALARVQGLLSRLGATDRIAFDELIRTEIKAMNGAAERVTLEGPAGIRLRSSLVQTLAMALHELATNAVKYGALSQPQAELVIGWRMTPPDRQGRPWLHIDWRESGVTMPPRGTAPQGTGQGRELIENALPYQLGAETSFELGPDGARCTLSIPVSASNDQQEPTLA